MPHVSHAVTFVTLVAFCDFLYSTQLRNNFKIIFNKHLVLIVNFIFILLTDAQYFFMTVFHDTFTHDLLW